MLKTLCDGYKVGLFLSSLKVRLIQSAFSFILCNCIHAFLCRPTCPCWHLSNLAASTKWQMILCQNSIQFDMTHSLWCQQQKICKAFPHSFYKICYFCTNIWFVEFYYLCLVLLPAVLDSEQTQSRSTLCVFVCVCVRVRVCVCVVLYRQGAPVCSVMGKTYSNECLLHKEACRKKRRIGKAHSGACIGTHTDTQKRLASLHLKAHSTNLSCDIV